MQRVGVYAPGGKAFYPSTVLMTAIPARVAGVQEVVLAVPVAGGTPSPVLLAAAAHAGVEEVWLMGGAQAIAALAYGTQSIRPVDKICGPGNVFVTAAKKQVYGDVGIDMLAGPSEVLVIADQTARVDWLIADLMAQAEHDEQAQSILLSEDKLLLEAVSEGLSAAVSNQPRQSIITASLASRGLLIHASSLAEAQRVTNLIAPEHLELAVAQPEEWLEKVQAAGAIFLGHHSPEVVGDYSAGPSHVLPTSGTARFASALGVYDFQLRQSLIQCSAEGVKAVTGAAEILAEEEGLYAHALSAVKRREG
jgi:histidinol dehydrogenase